MKIGIDYGGVTEFDEESWVNVFSKAKENGHEIFLLSHSHSGEDYQRRVRFCEKCEIHNITFFDVSEESEVANRKAELVKEYGINVFIDDYANRCNEVYRQNPNCICIISPPSMYKYVQSILLNL